jgi:hypothetical protein
MARPEDASPNPFVGYVATHGIPIADPLVGDESTTSDAPYNYPPEYMAVHPRDMSVGLLDNLAHEHESTIARAIDTAVKHTQLESPHWHILHDRLRTTSGWKCQIDALFEGTIAAPAAGATAFANIFRLNPLLPGNPGSIMVYPFVNLASVGAQGTTLTGVWSVDIIANGKNIPCGVYSGLSAGILRPETMGAPFVGDIDDKTPIAQLAISILTGATVAAVTFYAQVSISFVYDYVDDLPAVRRHGLRESEIGGD